MDKKKSHIYYTMSISFLSVLLNCFINLYLTPRITNTVGIEAYGFVALSKSFISFANIIMTALNSYAARYMSVAYIQGDEESYKKYFSTVFIADTVIGGLIFVAGLLTIGKLDVLLKISPDLIDSVKLLFLLTFVTFYLTIVSTVYFATGYVKDRLDLVNLIKGLSYVAEILILVFCYFILKPNVWYVSLASLLASVIMFYGTFCMTKRLVPESKVDYKLFSINALKKLVFNGLWNSANNLGNALNTGLDLLVTNLTLSAVGMGQVSVAKTISNLIYIIYVTIAQPFQPSFLRNYSEGNKDALIKELRDSMKVCGLITNVVFAGFCVVGLPFYNLWIPAQDTKLVYILTVLAMLPCISEGCIYPLYYVYTLTVKNKIPCIITIAGGLLNVVSMFALLNFTSLGIYSIMIPTAIIMNFINFVTNPLYISHCLNLKKTTFFSCLFINVIACIVTLVCFILLSMVLPEINSWKMLIIQVILYGVLGIIAQVIVLFKPKDILRLLKH